MGAWLGSSGTKEGPLERAEAWVHFEDAMLVFADPFAPVAPDRLEGGELRRQTLGLPGGVVLLLAAHTVRDEHEGEINRIVSARKATRRERRMYAQIE